MYLRLVNVGASSQVERGQIGSPVCLVCGQSRSPLASDAERENFAKEHEERCHQKVEPTGFYADSVADALTIHGCANREEGYSIAETLRLGAAHVLDMEVDDLQILAVGHPGCESVDMILYDPMAGGSGLLEHLLTRWAEVTGAVKEIAESCPGACAASCIDCLQMFRNAYYHKYLNRHVVLERLKDWGFSLTFSHAIPPKQATSSAEAAGQPVNQVESNLCDMLDRAGFPPHVCQKPIDLGRPLGQTHPDVFFEVPDARKEGVCIYLDGMNRHIHGNPETAQRDREIREELRCQGYEVIEIPASNLTDIEAMRRYFFRIGQILIGRDRATELRENTAWFLNQ